jgi:hypothetical protein
MDRKVKSFRLRVDLLDWVEDYARERGSKQIQVVEAALEEFRRSSEGGVPDLPPEKSGSDYVLEQARAAGHQVRAARDLVDPVVSDRQALLNQQAVRARAAQAQRGRR